VGNDLKSMGKTELFILQELYQREKLHNLQVGFAQKVLNVLLAEAVSNTFFQFLLVWLDSSDGMLAARTLYAVLISIFAPMVSLSLAKSQITKGVTFLAITMSLVGKICPVLLAWAWKDWAKQLDSWAGTGLWDEVSVAVALTIIVAAAQATPCYARAQHAVKSGENDTLWARMAVLPGNLGLTLGFVWNMVARYFVGEVQEWESAQNWEYQFLVQFVYTVVFGLFAAFVTTVLHRQRTARAAHVDAEKTEANTDHGEVEHATQSSKQLNDMMHDWSNHMAGWIPQLLSILSFIYAWAFLDLSDAWGLGVICWCESSSACSYQNNFLYALATTVACTYSAKMLHACQQAIDSSGFIANVISLQLNAMMLTVGWTWMNFYTGYMDYVTRHDESNSAAVVMTYITVLFVLTVAIAKVNYVFQRACIALAKYSERMMEELEKDATSEQV